MKSTDIVQPHAMPSIFAEDVYSSTSTANFAIPDATSTSATDTCVMDDGFLPITSEPLDDGGIAPERKNFNGLFYLSTDQRVFLQNGGFVTFNANVSSAIGGYPQGAILGNMDSNGRFSFVKSLIDDNTYNFVATPSYIDGEHWEYASIKIDLSNAEPAQSFINTALGWGSPDYDNSISITVGSTSVNAYVVTDPCVFFASVNAGPGTYNCSLYVNTTNVAFVARQDAYNQFVNIYLRLNPGDKLYWGNIPSQIAFQRIAPLKGGS